MNSSTVNDSKPNAVNIPRARTWLPNRLCTMTSLVPPGKSTLDVDLVDHFGNAFHHILAGQDFHTEFHRVRNRSAVPDPFENLGCNERGGFRMMELESARDLRPRATSAAVKIRRFSAPAPSVASMVAHWLSV